MSKDLTLSVPFRTASSDDAEVVRLSKAASSDLEHLETLKHLVDECIDIPLNYRQSGHPGGSRSKVHMFLSLLLSGGMRWDLRRPWLAYGDRFVLAAGHTVPLIYSVLAVLNEGLRSRYEATGDGRFAFPDEGRFALTWEDLLGLRRRGGLPGHAEMAGKTLFLKFNTGPSGHGMAPAAGEALALKLAGAEDVKVFAVEGEGGLTPGGAFHETKNAAWGLGLSNLVFLIDWNDFGIDPRPLSSVVTGTPVDWFQPAGWRVVGTEHGSEWGPVVQTVLDVRLRCQPRTSLLLDRLVQDPEGSRVRQGRRCEPWHAVAPAQQGVLGCAPRVHGSLRRRVRRCRQPRTSRCCGAARTRGSQPSGGHERAAQ